MPIDFLKKAAFFSLLGVIASAAFSISFYEITTVIFILLSMTAFFLDPDKKLLQRRWVIFFGVYFLANLLSLTQTHYPTDSLKGLLRIARLILLCFSVIYTVDSKEKFKKIFLWYLGVAFFIAADGLFQGIAGYEVIRQRAMTKYFEDTGRITGTFRHANDFSAYLALTLFLFIGILSEAKNLLLPLKKTIPLFLGFLALLASILWTYSRGAWVAVCAAFILMVVLKRKNILFLFLLLFVGWMLFLAPPFLRGRVQSLWDPKNGTIRERKILMQESFDMLEQSPWLGMGLNTFSDNAPFYKSKQTRTDVQYTHNGYLQMAVETGIVGLLSFLFLLLYFFASTAPVLLRRPVRFLEAGGSALVFGVLAFLIHSATDTDLHSVLLVGNLWLCMGLAWSASRLADEKAFSV